MLQVGDIVRTSYGSGPYRIVDIERNCRCPDYLDVIEGKDNPSKLHMHLVCVDANEPIRERYSYRKLRWLNGYREYPNGTIRCIWRPQDYLIVEGSTKGVQLQLFSSCSPQSDRHRRRES